jgi:hypothetical protein
MRVPSSCNTIKQHGLYLYVGGASETLAGPHKLNRLLARYCMITCPAIYGRR